MSLLITDTTDATFEQDVLQAGSPVLLDFWAPWCSPCLALNPTMERLAALYDGRVRIVKLNVDENPEVAARMNVRSIPRLMLFSHGEVKHAQVSHSQAAIRALFDDLVGTHAGSDAAADAPTLPAVAVVPSFGGDPARKADLLRRLRDAVFDDDHLPANSVETETGGFADTIGGPVVLGKMFTVLWDWLRDDPATSAQADDGFVALVDALPVGIDLQRLSQVMMNWLLHDPVVGIRRYASTAFARALCDRLAALHRRELNGERVPDAEWLALQREFVAAGEWAARPDAPPQHTDQDQDALRPTLADLRFVKMVEDKVLPLVDSDLPNLLLLLYSFGMSAAMDAGKWTVEDHQQKQAVYEATWQALSSSLGEEPSDDDADALAQWRAKRNAIEEQVRLSIRDTHPELQARIDGWERAQRDECRWLGDAVRAQFFALCACAPKIAAAG
ncbi:thioredoxin [Paraburkholderia caballeronis]|uniref:thioredoxin family protein n=1 Tax=Paraburkholderia caballeronis TaxID=416943 RepID=UPI0010665F5B|nr:thioredoxin domain-containing protein [Paraburkholderia caballeronis]TDV39160.1 thioredoxin [Paraburkholderia caballeronis]